MSVIGKAAGIAHGTVRGWRQHNYRKVEMCDECRKAYNADQAAKRSGEKPRLVSEAQAYWLGATGTYHKEPDRPAVQIQPAVTELPPGAVWGRDLQLGHVIDFLGRGYPVEGFEPYRGGLAGVLGDGTRVARSGTWGMTVGPDAVIRLVQPDGVR